METTNRHISATSLCKYPEVVFKGAAEKEWEECGVFLDPAGHQRSRIICAYLRMLEDMRAPVAADCELPFSKEQIGQAILHELAEDPEADLRRRLEIAFVMLESFIPYEEYRVIEDFKTASVWAQQIADTGSPMSILRSARIMREANGDHAVRLQEKIYEKMREKQRRIEELRKNIAC